ncbi:MAG: T9SS type A sorting domain-containing protein, partial [Ferruginibacter sp.]
GTAGGTYSAAPAGLVINAATGDVNLATSTAGTYTVTYTIAAGGGCPAVTATTTITITTLPAATISYAGNPYCQNAGTANVTRTGTAGGTYSATPAGLVINAATGDVNLATSTPGTYTVTYTLAAGGGCGAVTATTTITVSSLSVAATAATASSTSLCGPTAITLSVTGGSLGSGASWKWYSGTCGGTLVGTGATLNLTVSTTTTYFVRAEGACNTTTCASVTVTVNVQPTITLTATSPTSLMPGQTSTLTATVTPGDPTNTTVWYRNGIVVPGVTGLTHVVGVDALGLYTVRTTTTAGCTALSNAVLIKDSATAAGIVWIYPNPNNGQFKVRYYTNAQQLGFVRHIVLFASNGQRVFDNTYPITGPYSNMDIDARELPKGVYVLMLTDAFGKEVLASGKVVIQ